MTISHGVGGRAVGIENVYSHQEGGKLLARHLFTLFFFYFIFLYTILFFSGPLLTVFFFISFLLPFRSFMFSLYAYKKSVHTSFFFFFGWEDGEGGLKKGELSFGAGGPLFGRGGGLETFLFYLFFSISIFFFFHLVKASYFMYNSSTYSMCLVQ